MPSGVHVRYIQSLRLILYIFKNLITAWIFARGLPCQDRLKIYPSGRRKNVITCIPYFIRRNSRVV